MLLDNRFDLARHRGARRAEDRPVRRNRMFVVESLELRTPPSDSFAAFIGLGGALGAFDAWGGPHTAVDLGRLDRSLLSGKAALSEEIVSAFEVREYPSLLLPSLREAGEPSSPQRPATYTRQPVDLAVDDLMASPFDTPHRPRHADKLLSEDLGSLLSWLPNVPSSTGGAGGTASGPSLRTATAAAGLRYAAGDAAADRFDGPVQAPLPRPHGQIRPLRFERAPDAVLNDVSPDLGSGGVMMSGESGGSGGNEPPSAGDDSGGTGTAVLGEVFHVPNSEYPNILDNDEDPDPEDTVTFSRVVQPPAGGTLTMGPLPDGTFEYTPRRLGEDEFTYTATDGSLESNVATVKLRTEAPLVDIDTDSDNSGEIDQTPQEDGVEEDLPGGSGGSGGVPGNVIAWNNDDDDGDGQEDRFQGPGPLTLPSGGPFNDDDLEAAILKVDDILASDWVSGAAGGAEGLLDGVSLHISRSGNLALWRSQDKEPLDLAYNFSSQGAPSNVPDEIYVEGFLLGPGTVTWELIAPTDANPGGEVVASDTVKFTVVDVNLTIHDGGTVPAEVLDDEEESRGAFTVANWNDTDGDGDSDYLDWDGVTENDYGRDEVDLMELVLDKPADTVHGWVTLTVPARVWLWEEQTKLTQIPVDDAGVAYFSAADFASGEKTIYAEITAPSVALRDVVMEMDYYGVTDTVAATGIWTEIDEVSFADATYADLILQSPWDELVPGETPQPRMEAWGGTGLRPVPTRPDIQDWVGNAIWMSFTVGPPGIQDVSRINFDVTRRIEANQWKLDSNKQILSHPEEKDLPKENEEANDDRMPEVDESLKPNSNLHMFVEDVPRVEWDDVNTGETYCVMRFTAEEFVRVGINTTAEGNGTHGSRCLEKYEWHVNHTLVDDGTGHWERDTTGVNDVGPGDNLVWVDDHYPWDDDDP